MSIRVDIVAKLNAEPFNPNHEFTQDEIEYMLTRYLSTHTKSKVGNIKLHHYIDGDKEKIGLKVVLNEQ